MDERLLKSIIQINELSKDIYGKEMRISAILAEAGFCEAEIAHLQDEGLRQFMYNIDLSLRASLLSHPSGERLFYVLYRRYSLFGCEKQTLELIGDRYGITREGARQIQIKALGYLGRGVFERIVVVSAYMILNTDIYAMPEFNARTKPENKKRRSRPYKTPFCMTDEMRANLFPFDRPVSLTEFMKMINSLRDRNMRSLSGKYIIKLLLDAGLLEMHTDDDGKLMYIPSVAGRELGIFTGMRVGYRSKYIAVLYRQEAQQFLIDNIDAVIQLQNSDCV